ncbi:MAG: hypothetical protein AAGC43_04965 [Bacteroidota bacterium]
MIRKTYIAIFTTFFLVGVSQNTSAQFLKKLAKKTETKLLQKTEEVTESILDNKKTNTSKENPKSEPIQKDTKSQSKEPAADLVQDSGILTYDSPNPLFKGISVQQHKGVPRFGSCDFYFSSPNRLDLTPEGRAKRKLMEKGYLRFKQMVEINLLKDLFNSIDKTALTPESRTMDEEVFKSRKAQQLLKNFAFYSGTEAFMKDYFCNEQYNSGNCQIVNEWGGMRADDFTENEKYVDFVEKYMNQILNWSTSFFPEETQTFYFVQQLKDLGTYDFDNNGFWISLPHKVRNGKGFDYTSTGSGYFYTFLPKTAYGQQVLNKTSQVEYYSGKVLFKIDAGIAERIVNNRYRDLQIVAKVRVVSEGVSEANPFSFNLTYSYHFEDPIVEIFEDAQLTQKLGSLDMRQLIYKEN